MKATLTNLSGLVFAVMIVGCTGPMGIIPGGELEGPETRLTDADILDDGVIQLETRPSDPYSVNIGFVAIDGTIYIDPDAERSWYGHIVNNPQVRIRLDGKEQIYPATAVAVEDKKILAQFDPERMVLKLVPR